MKKEMLFIILTCFIVLSTFVSADTSYYEENFQTIKESGTSTVELTKLRYEPYPASPGGYVTIYIQAEKVGSTPRDVQFEFIEEYPFSLDNQEDAIKVYKDLGSEEIVLEYKVRVDDSAVSGVNTLKIRQTLSSSSSIIHEFDINIEDVQTSFDAVVQESTSEETTIALANIGQNDANAAIVKIPHQDGVKVVGTAGQMIGNLEQGDYTVVSFNIAGMSDALNLEVDYTDAIGFRRSEIIEVPLGSGAYSRDASSTRTRVPGSKMGMQQEDSSGSSYTWAIWLFVALVLIYFGYNHHKKSLVKKGKSNSFDWMKKEKKARK